jgi:pyrimidine operon attenuation protein/uracil phosphoribosyltransferase
MVKTNRNKIKLIMDTAGIDLALTRIAAEIIERLDHAGPLAVLGIRRRGVHPASRLCSKLDAIRKQPTPQGVLDITLYRDDLTTVSERPMLRSTSIAFDINRI